MKNNVRPRRRALALLSTSCGGLVLLAALLTGCGSINVGLNGDPCLLQQYQGHSFGLVSGTQGAYSTLMQKASVLTSAPPSIGAQSDISDTLTSISEFVSSLAKERALLDAGAQPPEGKPFRALMLGSFDNLTRGAKLLTQVYGDAHNGDTIPANAIALAARSQFATARLQLDQANVVLARLATYSPNC